jgi:hypothetical protein
LNQANAEGMELRVHAIHGFAIMLYCDGLLKVSEKTVRHATPAYQEVTRRIERFALGKFPRNQKQKILGRIAYVTNLRHSLLASPHVTARRFDSYTQIELERGFGAIKDKVRSNLDTVNGESKAKFKGSSKVYNRSSIDLSL